jgi:hypothetical protein
MKRGRGCDEGCARLQSHATSYVLVQRKYIQLHGAVNVPGTEVMNLMFSVEGQLKEERGEGERLGLDEE